MLQIKHLLIFVGLLVVVNAQSNYCKQESCSSGGVERPHIGCKNSGDFSETCSGDAEIVKMDKKKQNLLVKMHNRLRDRFARGAVPGFAPAAKMPMLKWNDELAKLAEYNVRTCKFAHDKCRAIDVCPYAGQNLAQMMSYPTHRDLNYVLKNLTREWFWEYRWAKQSQLDNYVGGPGKDNKQIGHFTAFVHEKTDKVGCAIARFTNEHNFKETLLACNYCYTNMMKERIYTQGKPCSQCQSKKCGPVYKNLCDPSEKVDPTPDVLKQWKHGK
uniref:Antigen 5-related protein n=1 Tax=Lutzomyia longipalpis TaxID=7200 RepID=Q9XZ44_LUTLO|nr:antigen 5-related protein [Lutzomyia longipalpis]